MKEIDKATLELYMSNPELMPQELVTEIAKCALKHGYIVRCPECNALFRIDHDTNVCPHGKKLKILEVTNFSGKGLIDGVWVRCLEETLRLGAMGHKMQIYSSDRIKIDWNKALPKRAKVYFNDKAEIVKWKEYKK